ncbi:acyltransferase family protein [Arhodomonas sp. AD133]|uniref:acyltransferase family protein n=1 Tax=Arhodomonas sp. AD133 TaxID=3415009 RepID=UPI003EBB4B0C
MLIGHSWPLALGRGHHDPVSELTRSILPWHLGVPGIAVSLFFFLSGLLITRSYLQRGNLLDFLEARVLRLYPALIVCVGICVLGVGLVLTSLPAGHYLGHQSTQSYLIHNTTLVAGIDFWLPGLFADLPFKGINGSLWTLPYEVWMYLCAATLGVLTILRRRWLFNVLFVATLCAYGLDIGIPDLTGVKFERLGIFFLLGAFVYVNASAVRLSPIALALFLFAAWAAFKSPAYPLLGAGALAYAFLLVSFHPSLRLPNMDRVGDFSYGTYVYAFPVQQTVIHQLDNPGPWLTCLVSLLSVTPVAAASWYGIERPMLRFKGSAARLWNASFPRHAGRSPMPATGGEGAAGQ